MRVFYLILPFLILLAAAGETVETGETGITGVTAETAGYAEYAGYAGNSEPVKSADRVTTTDTLAAGVIHHHITEEAGPWNINVLEVDLKAPGVGIKVVKASDGQREALFAMERTSSMVARYDGRTDPDGYAGAAGSPAGPGRAARTGYGIATGIAGDRGQDAGKAMRVAMGGVNADFYNMQNGAPINLHISDGLPLRRPAGNLSRSVFLIYEDGTPHITIPEMRIRLHHKRGITPVTGLNEARQENGLVLYNRYYGNSTSSNRYGTEVMLRVIETDRPSGSVTFVADSVFRDQGNTVIYDGYYVLSAHGTAYNRINRHISAGDTVRVSYHYNSERPVAQAAGGMPQIVCGGVDCVDISSAKEGVSEGFINTRHPRTAVGISEDGTRLYLVTVDGRQPASVGMSLYELADLMTRLGAREALNLDGGGSTTLVAGSRVANRPSDPTGERPVSNAMLILVEGAE
jgi:hypothetical protein